MITFLGAQRQLETPASDQNLTADSKDQGQPPRHLALAQVAYWVLTHPIAKSLIDGNADSFSPLLLSKVRGGHPMLITRKKKVPLHWVFYAQLVFAMTIWAGFMTGAPFLLAMKKFIDNPAAITFLLSLDLIVTVLNGAFISWLSDRIWTRYGRRKILSGVADMGKFLIMPLMPFAPDMWTLVALKWLYTILSDIGSPNQALTMEVIPTAQRGRGAGFFQMQLNLANLIFWGVVIGRFDDVYFLGPLAGILSMSGEHLMFFSASFLFLAVGGFTFLGFKEIKPPNRQDLKADRRPGEFFIWTFIRSFFRDIVGRELLPLYLLLFVGAMANLGLGILGPLLYVEQWGYTTQEMGTNVAIGAFINIFVALLAGYFADTVSKMRVYVIALIVGLFLKCIWVAYVFLKPDYRPELWEIIIFGEITTIFSMIASTVSFPLILEYVERNRLGTAGAGMGLFNRILSAVLGVFIGAWVVWWSMWFLPQAGNAIEVVLHQPTDARTLRSQLDHQGLTDLHLKAEHGPGLTGVTSRHWTIRRSSDESKSLQEQRKKTENEISKWMAAQQSPLSDTAKRQHLQDQVVAARQQIADIDARLKSGASDFGKVLANSLGSNLVTDGQQIDAASLQSTALSLQVKVVEPITPKALHDLEHALESGEFAAQEATSDRAIPDLKVSQVGNSLRIDARLDAGFLDLDRSLVDAGVGFEAAFETTTLLVNALRDAFGRQPGAFTISNVQAAVEAGKPLTLSFALPHPSSMKSPDVESLRLALADLPGILSASLTATPASLQATLVLPPISLTSAGQESAITTRLTELSPNDDFARRYLEHFYHRSVAAAAAKPVYLTVERPFVKQGPVDRQYDYFFSVYFIMIVTDVFGLAVIVLIVHLEKRGTIRRRGVEEDLNR